MIKAENPSAKNGVYTIQPLPGGKSYEVYCNMQEYGGGWTLVTLIRSDSSDQWNPAALNPEDLSKFTTAPSRASKLPDAEINALLGKGGTRWVTAQTTRTFYRMSESPWYSNHGKSNSCGYKRAFYDAWAEAATKPTWKTTMKYVACGGINDGTKWGALSGIHVNPASYRGAYAQTQGGWNRNGYVYVRSLEGLCQLDDQRIHSLIHSLLASSHSFLPSPTGLLTRTLSLMHTRPQNNTLFIVCMAPTCITNVQTIQRTVQTIIHNCDQ